MKSYNYIIIFLILALTTREAAPMDQVPQGLWSIASTHPVFTTGAVVTGAVLGLGGLCVFVKTVDFIVGHNHNKNLKLNKILYTTLDTEELRNALKKGADKDYLNGRLSFAARDGNIDEAKLCLELGADPAKHGWHIDERSACWSDLKNAFMHATSNDHADIIELLFDHGADLTNVTYDSQPLLLAAIEQKALKTATVLLEKCKANSNTHDAKNKSALHVAVQYLEQSELTQLLVEKGANIFELDQWKDNPFDVALQTKKPQHIRAMIAPFIAEHPSIHFDAKEHSTLLPLAAYVGYCAAVQWLLNKGVDIHSSRKTTDYFDKDMAVHAATRAGHTDVLMLLFKCGGIQEMFIENSGHAMPLSIAIENGHVEVTRFLLNLESKLSNQDKKTVKASTIAKLGGIGQYQTMKLLIEQYCLTD